MFHVRDSEQRADLERRHRADRLPHLAVVGDLREEEAEDRPRRPRATARPASTATATTPRSRRWRAPRRHRHVARNALRRTCVAVSRNHSEHGAGRASAAPHPTSSTRLPAGSPAAADGRRHGQSQRRPAHRPPPSVAPAGQREQQHRHDEHDERRHRGVAVDDLLDRLRGQRPVDLEHPRCDAARRRTAQSSDGERPRHAPVIDRRPQPDAEAPARRHRRRRTRCSSPGPATRWRSGSSRRATDRRPSARRAGP